MFTSSLTKKSEQATSAAQSGSKTAANRRMFQHSPTQIGATRHFRLSLMPPRFSVRTGSSTESTPFCPIAFLVSAYQSGRWLVGAVGIEPTTFGLKGRCSTTELRP